MVSSADILVLLMVVVLVLASALTSYGTLVYGASALPSLSLSSRLPDWDLHYYAKRALATSHCTHNSVAELAPAPSVPGEGGPGTLAP